MIESLMQNQTKELTLGLVPKKLHDEKRFHDVCRVITEYFEAGKKIDVEWIKEYNEFIDKFHIN